MRCARLRDHQITTWAAYGLGKYPINDICGSKRLKLHFRGRPSTIPVRTVPHDIDWEATGDCPYCGFTMLSMHPRQPKPGGSRYCPSTGDSGGGRTGTRYNLWVESRVSGTSHSSDHRVVDSGMSLPESTPGDIVKEDEHYLEAYPRSVVLDFASHASSTSARVHDRVCSERLFSSPDARLSPPGSRAARSDEKKIASPCKGLCEQSKSGCNTNAIEVSPGVFSPLRGSTETWEAILTDMYLPSTCFWCTTTVFAIQDCGFVLCPKCGAVYPSDDDMIDRIASGVGLGFTFESLARWQPEIERHRRDRCNCGT